MLNYSLGSMLSLSWLRLWYGVFSEHGYPADNLYPGQESSCGAADWWRVCPEHKHYDGNLKTKQNMLCDGHSAREVINQQHRDKQLLLSNGTSSIKFSYVRPLASSYRLLLDTSSYMGESQRWENVRRALHRFIHLLPLGTIIRLVLFTVMCSNVIMLYMISVQIPVSWSDFYSAGLVLRLAECGAVSECGYIIAKLRWFLCCSQICAIKKGES